MLACVTLCGVLDDATARRLLHTWALDAEAFALVLNRQDPTWRSEVHHLAGGRLVLCGSGLYVNRAIGAGIDEPLRRDDVALIVDRSAAVGVEPAIEVTPYTRADATVQLGRAGFVHDATGDVTVLTVPAIAAAASAIDAPDDIIVRPVVDDVELDLWLTTTALGWGHDTRAARTASDAFTRAAHVVDGEGMVLAFDRSGGRPVGCASTTLRDGIATLGGMSTIPTERRRGVQAALVRHRLARAAELGCELAASTASTGGASERNLMRLGFEAHFAVETWTRRGVRAPR